MKNLFLFLCIIVFCFFSQNCQNRNPKQENIEIKDTDTLFSYLLRGLPVIDLTIKYPEKELVVNDDDKEFIPLETTKEVLADQDFRVVYVSDERIVGRNGRMGDIFIFDRNGKIVSHFNHKGNSGIEYLEIMSIVYDESRKEIFVADHLLRNRCVVYSEDGKFLRQFNFPPRSWIIQLCNFDDQTLLAYNGVSPGSANYSADDTNQEMPYVFLSKNDGSVVSRLDISLSQRVSERHSIRVEQGMIPFVIRNNNIVKSGQEFIIADSSSDTVFLLTKDKMLTPLFVRKPSVFDERPFIVSSVNLRTDSYIFFSTFTYNWSDIIAQFERGQQPQIQSNYFAFDLRTGQVFSVSDGPGSSVFLDAPKGVTVRRLFPDDLIEDLENGKLEGKLREIAQNIGEEDNPVVEIINWNR